jgi:hypothetical protein
MPEPDLWAVQQPLAQQAFNFWATFMALAGGPDNNRSLTEDEAARWMCIIRAVSWVESQHGTVAGQTHGDTDPMQCGNPGDTFWQELIGAASQFSRFVGGPGAGNFNTNELPAAVAGSGSAPPLVLLSVLGDQTQGHNDGAFNPTLSYFWGIVWLIHRANTASGTSGKFYKCDDSSRARLVTGAINYNGGGDPNYGQKINAALDASGCMG